MKHIVVLIATIVVIGMCASAENGDHVEATGVGYSEYIGGVKGLHPVRIVNGGTVLKVKYQNCNNDMQGAFNYACKILEEYLPPSLPITIKVGLSDFGTSDVSTQAISKIKIKAYNNFGRNYTGYKVPMTLIKRVVLKEYEINSNVTFIDSIPNVKFLNNIEEADIEISYNSALENEFSYSLGESCARDKYDFVSVALRDLLKGLGFRVNYIKNANSDTFVQVSKESMPFESKVESVIRGKTPEETFKNATKGVVNLPPYDSSVPGIKLYAPERWEHGISLNYFVADSIYSVSSVLRQDFGKGTICRNINDRYSNYIFRTLLGWQEDFSVSVGASSSSHGGSTNNYMPYKGSLTLKSYRLGEMPQMAVIEHDGKWRRQLGINPVYDYCDKFHAFQTPEGYDLNMGSSISILKKDGTWDLVYFTLENVLSIVLNMNDWEFHCSDEDYARTCDGFLRVRATFAYERVGTSAADAQVYNSEYFVLDYLPQNVELQSYEFRYIPSEIANLNDDKLDSKKRVKSVPVKNIEGIDKIVLERIKPNHRVPSRIEIDNFKNGCIAVPFDEETEANLKAFAYNTNGMSVSKSTKIKFQNSSVVSSEIIAMRYNNRTMEIALEDDSKFTFIKYRIIDAIKLGTIEEGMIYKEEMDSLKNILIYAMDLSELQDGTYYFECVDNVGRNNTIEIDVNENYEVRSDV